MQKHLLSKWDTANDVLCKLHTKMVSLFLVYRLWSRDEGMVPTRIICNTQGKSHITSPEIQSLFNRLALLMSAFVISETHKSQKPCRRQLNTKVCGIESAIFLCSDQFVKQRYLKTVQVLPPFYHKTDVGALWPLSVFIAANSPWLIKVVYNSGWLLSVV